MSSGIWSMDEHLNSKHPFTNAKLLCYSEHWGAQTVFAKIEGPYYRDLKKAAFKCIDKSGDNHHVFVEAFEVSNDDRILFLWTGS